jgi:WhiB family redox-sensing transcriptional regulator
MAEPFQTGEKDGWQIRGKCRDVPDASEIFFPVRGADVKVPKAICAGCPVKADCLEYALEFDLFGIWGGTGQNERRRLIKARRQQPEVDLSEDVHDGTNAGYVAHRRAGETPCIECKAAHARYKADYKRTRRLAKGRASA